VLRPRHIKRAGGKIYPKRLSTRVEIAMVHTGLGNKEQTFVWLEKTFQDRSGELPRIRWYPSFASVRDDPRYKDLLKRMGLPE
jgi:hypothetical protein